MQRARVIGSLQATVKHPTMQGRKMLLVQPLGVNDQADGYPLIAVDTVGAGAGECALITSDGRFARSSLGSDQTPVRWTIIGLED